MMELRSHREYKQSEYLQFEIDRQTESQLHKGIRTIWHGSFFISPGGCIRYQPGGIDSLPNLGVRRLPNTLSPEYTLRGERI
jgi:hypothetical protein